MIVEISVDGRPWKVGLEPAEGPGLVAVTVKGRRRVVDASWIDTETFSLVDGGVAHEVRIHPRENGVVGVEVGGRVYEVAVEKRLRDPVSAGDTPKTAPGAISITAPMPGRVARVLVAVGDRVTARQGVVVVEAMKMENELRAPKDGTVKEVLARPGAAVESGAVLVVIT